MVKPTSIQDWLLADQHSYGEWGKSENKDPTRQPRTYEDSLLKPNVFTSCTAAYALVATGLQNHQAITSFYNWLQKIRNSEGWWTSAGGSLVPMGQSQGWAEVQNIRHTAKGLDVLLLNKDFVPDDATLFQTVVNTQLPIGAYPQHPNGSADLWATAYVMNLLIRASHPEHVRNTLPRHKSESEWTATLRNHLDHARAWICKQRDQEGLWTVGGVDPSWVTEAVVAQIGGDLSLNRKDICRSLAPHMLGRAENGRPAVALWGLILMWRALDSAIQKRVIELLRDLQESEDLESDTFSASCHCRLASVANDPMLLQYYVHTSDGHESVLDSWRAWASSDYEKWCVNRAVEFVSRGVRKLDKAPVTKVEAWITVIELIEAFRHQVEGQRGWESLWANAQSSADETTVQRLFNNIAAPLAASHGIQIDREPETGRGPVDFQFSNGLTIRIHVEFKLLEHRRLKHGLEVQLPEYMRAQQVDSAFFICVGFDEGAKEKYQTILPVAENLRIQHQELFIQTVFVDARRRQGASKP